MLQPRQLQQNETTFTKMHTPHNELTAIIVSPWCPGNKGRSICRQWLWAAHPGTGCCCGDRCRRGCGCWGTCCCGGSGSGALGAGTGAGVGAAGGAPHPLCCAADKACHWIKGSPATVTVMVTSLTPLTYICQIHNTMSCYGDRPTLTTWSSSSRCDIVHFLLPAVSLTLSLSVWGACHLIIPHSLTHSHSLHEVHAITQSSPQSLSVWGARHLIIPHSLTHSHSLCGVHAT